MLKILTGALLVMLAMPNTASAYFPSYFQELFQTFPDCSNGTVKARIIARFNWADRATFYRGVSIRSIDYESEQTIDSFGEPGVGAPIDRRYCKARAWLNNGKSNVVYYRIERGMGLAGIGFKVEFCLPGYDRWHVYDGACRVLRH
ncbi:MAG: hypothetical protein LJE67_06405 [Salaquimonas sp.]|jgi:hypothetical protein|nr:hypothetical protein [Salaquimonas sp.]